MLKHLVFPSWLLCLTASSFDEKDDLACRLALSHGSMGLCRFCQRKGLSDENV